jgi:hypothetical protein
VIELGTGYWGLGIGDWDNFDSNLKAQYGLVEGGKTPVFFK